MVGRHRLVGLNQDDQSLLTITSIFNKHIRGCLKKIVLLYLLFAQTALSIV